MIFSKQSLRVVGLTAGLVLASACANEDAIVGEESSDVVASETPPGLPPGTVVVPLPVFGEEPRVEKIPNAVGHLQAWTLGKGSTAIVIINGGAGLSSTYVTRLHHGIAEKVPGARVVRYDQRGMGQSSKTTTAQNTVRGHVDDVEAIRKYLGVEKLHLVGQSFGGFVGGAYASMHPERVASFVSIDGVPPLPADHKFNKQADEVYEARLNELIAKGILLEAGDNDSPDVAANKSAGLYFADPHRIPIEDTSPSTESNETVYNDIDADWRANGAPMVADARKLRLPVLVIAGDKSPFGSNFPDGNMEVLREAKPKLLMLANAGHEPWAEKPTEVFGAIETFYAPFKK